MLLGGMNFFLIVSFLRLRWGILFRTIEIRFYFAFVIFFAVTASIALHYRDHSEGVEECMRHGVFHAISFMTTTGFVAADYDHWLPVTHILLLIAMLLGGCSGSTAGGIKIIRIVTMLKIALASCEQAFRPNLIRPITIDGRACSEKMQTQIINYVFLVALTLIFLLPVYALIEPALSFKGSLSSYSACLSNTGIAFAEFGVDGSYVHLHDYSKWFLCFIMLLGRLEMQAIFALFIPSFWRKFT
jgi:trk system potassium uptake protein TrkH